MERELRPPRFGFFPSASLSDSSLRPQRAEKAPVFATHALRLKARPVYFGGRLEVWLVIVRRNLRRDFGVACQILWVSCAVYFSSAKKALHGVTAFCATLARALASHIIAQNTGQIRSKRRRQSRGAGFASGSFSHQP